MRRAQIFTLDLVLGSVIILSILSTTYAISSYYSTVNNSLNIKSNIMDAASSAASAFSITYYTDDALVQLHTTHNTAVFLDYVKSTLGAMMVRPYSLTVLTKTNYSGAGIPNVPIFDYTVPGFDTLSYSAFYEPVIVTNSSTLCYSYCDPSLSLNDVFPGQSALLSAAECSVLYGNGSVTGWTVLNNTPSGKCTIEVPSSANPQNYLVNAYSGPGAFEGNTTLHVVVLDLLEILVGT